MKSTHCIKIFCFSLGLATLWPVSTYAAVVINEVAWMGNDTSANDEWIELYNDGEAADLTGWTLTDGRNLEITLSGTIAAGTYVVLKRTDDNSAPGTAFMLYTGALSNTGGTLTLYDSQDAMVDQVAGGEGWENIGGDNVTKETAQLTSAGWVTASPTPGAPNKQSGSSQSKESQTERTETEVSDDSSTKTVDESSNDVSQDSETTLRFAGELKVEVTVPTRLYQNQKATFIAEPSGVRGSILRSLHYEWNFGDGMMSTAEEPVHRYQYPGNYIVTLVVHRGEHEVEYRSKVTVLPAKLSVSRLPNGDVQLHNEAKYEIDVSGYKVGGLHGVVLPPRTIMLPNSTITLAANRFKEEALTMVIDSVGQMVYGAETVPSHYTYSPSNTSASPLVKGAASSTMATAETISQPTLVASSADKQRSAKDDLKWPWYALFGLLSLATLGIYTRYI